MAVASSSPPRSLARQIDAGRMFEAAARRFRDKAALVAESGSRSYAELLARTGQVARLLRQLGVRRGEPVALMLPNGITFIEAWWGVVRSGAIVAPTSPRATPEDLAAMLRVIGARALIIGGASLQRHAQAIRDQLPQVTVLCLDMAGPEGSHDLEGLMSSAAASAESPEEPPLPLDAPCAIYFTAGSTGQPKGVLRSHQSVAWGLSMLAQRLSTSDVLLARAPMAHTGGSLTGPFAVLIAGGTLVLPPDSSVDGVLASAARHRVTALYVHPTAFAKEMLSRLRTQAVDLGSLRRLQWTAGPLPEPVRTALFERFPTLPLEVTFGMTEASNIASIEYPAGSRTGLAASNCVGYPLPGAEIRVVDAQAAPLPDGVEGDILTRTPTAFDGYWQDAAATAQAVTPDGWLRTGDVGHIDPQGALHLNGRSREIIKSGGMTVHPAEVEQALARHPQVLDATVFAQPHPVWDEAVVAAIVLRAEGPSPSRTELLAHCRAHLAAYKVPKDIHLMTELPRNASGKVDKRRLIALLPPTSDTA